MAEAPLFRLVTALDFHLPRTARVGLNWLKNRIVDPFFPNDYVFLSFPKSGRTWVRYFLGRYYACQYGVCPLLRFNHIVKPHRSIPRIGFTHSTHEGDGPTELDLQVFEGKDCIMLVRDPRDVVVSYYFHCRTRERVERLKSDDMTLKRFIRDPEYGIGRVIEYMNFFYAHRSRAQHFKFIRYRDIKSNPSAVFRDVLAFMGEPVDAQDPCLQKALDESTFERMRQSELANEYNDRILCSVDPSDPESYRVRRGKVGGYEDYFDEEDLAYVSEQMKRLNPDFGFYE